MKAEFAGRCAARPAARAHAHAVRRGQRRARGARGPLRCRACAREFAVHRGVPELLHDAAGAHRRRGRRAGALRRADARPGLETARRCWRCPNLEHGYWYVQARSMHQLLTTVPFRAGQSRSWTSARTPAGPPTTSPSGDCARSRSTSPPPSCRGCTRPTTSSRTVTCSSSACSARWTAIPLASSSVDYVYCCEVLHHNDPAGLRRTFAEIFRVLRPGGRLLMVNETLKTLRDPHGVQRRGGGAVRGLRARPLGAPLPLGGDARRLPDGGDRAPLPRLLRRRRAHRRRAGCRPRSRNLRGRFAFRAAAQSARAARLSGLAEQRRRWRVDEHDRHQAARATSGATSGWRRPSACCAHWPPACASRATAAAAWPRRACRARPSRRSGSSRQRPDSG